MDSTGKILDFAKRHLTWLILIICTLMFVNQLGSDKVSIQQDIDKIVANTSQERLTLSDYNKITELEAKKENTAPLIVLLYVVLAVCVTIPLSSLVLFAYTKVPFTKALFLSKNLVLDPAERLMFALVTSAVYLGVAIITAFSIILLLKF